MYIILANANETIRYAALELKKYLKRIYPAPILLYPVDAKYPIDAAPKIELGLSSDFSSLDQTPLSDTQDGFDITIESGNGHIIGNNPRSVLYAVYHLLREIGFEWPNPQTEVFIAKKGVENGIFSAERFSWHCKSTAEHRHRGIVIEGANSPDNITSLLEWMPKLYYNSYFIQFQTPYHFFANWYHHIENPLLKPQDFSEPDAASIKKAIELSLKKYGFLYHGVGHAWTSESIGIKGLGWEERDIALKDEQKEVLAMTKGARQLFDKVALNTNLCYSNPKAIRLFCDEVIRYLKETPSLDYLHIWLADGFNNFCECPACKGILPADQYIELLNALDDALTKKRIATKLVFLVYNDLLWAPLHQRLHHPERFVLMFAPITRTFESSYADMGELPTPKEYVRNRIRMPHSVEENISYLKEWQKTFRGDSFIFDYPLGRAHYGDAGYIKIAKTIYKDIKTLKKLGLNGYLSCQEQRCFFPHALPNYLMGRMLWNSDLSFEEICNDFFTGCYGQNGIRLFPILQEISEVFSTDYWNRIIPHSQPQYAHNLAVIPKLAKRLTEEIRRQMAVAESSGENRPAFTINLQTLSYLPEYIEKMALCLAAKSSGQDEAASRYLHDFSQFVQSNELNLQESLDVFRVLHLAYNFVGLGNPHSEGN